MTSSDDTDLTEYYLAVGRLSVEFSTAETQMHFLAWVALGLTADAGRAVTQSMFANDLVRLLQTLADLRKDQEPPTNRRTFDGGGFALPLPSDTAEALREVVDEFRALSEERNGALHGMGPAGGGLTTVREVVKTVASPRTERPRKQPEQIERAASRCAALSERIAQLSRDIAGWRYSRQPTSD